jgi:hypothetical protein
MSWLISRAMMEAYENSRSSQALVEAFSAATCSDGEPSAQLNVMPTPHPFWHRDRMMEPSDLSRSGLTCRALTADRGAALLTWFLAGFPARTSASPAAVTDSTASDPASGWKWPASFAKWDQATSSWKTRQCSLVEDSTAFSGPWPEWGSMRDGECLEQTTLVPTSTENESGFWQTPTTRDGKGQSGKGNRIKRGKGGRLHVANLCDQIVDCGRPDLVRSIPFRYSLMGWPDGWTDFAPLETAKFQRWLRLHGAC